MASAETTSAGMRAAIAAATSDLPLAVGPKRPMTRAVTAPRADALEVVVAYAYRSEKGLDAAVTSLQLRENAPHRLRRSRGNLVHARELFFGCCGSKPGVVAR